MASATIFLFLGCIIFVTSVSGQASVSNVSCSEPVLDGKTWNWTAFCSAMLYGEASNGLCYWSIERINNTKEFHSVWVPGSVQPAADGGFLWNCSVNDRFPYTNGSYDIYIQFYLQTMMPIKVFNITVEPPELEVSCPDYIIEGGPPNCTCHLKNNPKPSPLLSWDDSHDYREVRTIFFSKDKVNRDQNGESHSCHAKWSSETVSKNFTLRVAYGPDQVMVEKIQPTNINGVEVIDLKCTAMNVFPGVKFTWSVPCLNTTISTESSDCTYRLAPGDNGKTVECTATNNITNISQNASYILTYTGVVMRQTTYSSNDTSSLPEKVDKGVPVLYIAVGAGCGLLAIVLCVIVICCIRRRNQGKEGVRFRGGVMRQSIKPTAVAARILQSPEGDKSAIVVDDVEDDVPSNDPVAKQAQSAIYDILNKRKKEVKFAEKSSFNLANAQNQRNEPQKQRPTVSVSVVSTSAISQDNEREAVTRL